MQLSYLARLKMGICLVGVIILLAIGIVLAMFANGIEYIGDIILYKYALRLREKAYQYDKQRNTKCTQNI
jgi:hypothetical protein